MTNKLLSILLLAVLLLTACNPQSTVPQSPIAVSNTSSPFVSTDTPTAAPTYITATATMTQAPTATVTITMTNTPTITPTSAPVQINGSNVARIQEVGRYGEPSVYVTTYTRDGRLAIVGTSEEIRFYDAATFTLQKSIPVAVADYTDSSSPLLEANKDGSILLVKGTDALRVVNNAGETLWSRPRTGMNDKETALAGFNDNDAASISPDGTLLAVTHWWFDVGHTLEIIRLADSEVVFTGKGKPTFSEGILAAEYANQLYLYSIIDWKEIVGALLLGDANRSYVLSSDGTMVGIQRDSVVEIWRIADRKMIRVITLGGSKYLDFSPDSSRIRAMVTGARAPFAVYVYEVATGEKVGELSIDLDEHLIWKNNNLEILKPSAMGEGLLGIAAYNTVQPTFFFVDEQQVVVPARDFGQCLLNLNGQANCGSQVFDLAGKSYPWEIGANREFVLPTLNIKIPAGYGKIIWDEKLLYGNGGFNTGLRDVKSGWSANLEGMLIDYDLYGTEYMAGIRINSDAVVIYNAKGQVVFTRPVRGFAAVAASALLGNIAYTVCQYEMPNSDLVILDVASGFKEKARFQVPHPANVRPADLLLMPDGTILVGLDNGEVVAFSPDGSELFRWQAHQGGAMHLALSPSGTKIASTSSDGLTKIWSVFP